MIAETTRKGRDERGVVLVLAAISLTALLAVTALAIDIGNARQERRNRQNFADAIALAAGQDLVGSAPDENAASATAEQVLATNDPGASFVGCVDPNPLPYAPVYSCVSFDGPAGASTLVRVLTPDEDVATFFAGVIGVTEVTTDAFAVAQVKDEGEFGGVLPFGFPGGTGSGEVCPSDDPSPHATLTCNGPAQGNFGTARIFAWTQGCQPGSGKVVSDNLANGPDHGLSTMANFGDPVINDSVCPPASPDDAPNTLSNGTGNPDVWIHRGLLSSDPGHFLRGAPGRLLRGDDGTGIIDRASAYGVSGVDATPIYKFIPTGATNVPDSCMRERFDDIIAGAATPADAEAAIYTVVDQPFAAFGYDGLDPATALPYSPGADADGDGTPDFPGQMQLCFLEYEYGDFYDQTTGALWRDPGPDGLLGTRGAGADLRFNSADDTTDDLWFQPDPPPPTPIPIQNDPGCGGGDWPGFASTPCGALFTVDTVADDGVPDILRTPRAGYVPQYWQFGQLGRNCADPDASGLCNIQRFRAVYINALIDSSGGGAGFWRPGFGDGPPAGNVDALSAYALHPNMLPDNLATVPPCQAPQPCQLGEIEQIVELVE